MPFWLMYIIGGLITIFLFYLFSDRDVMEDIEDSPIPVGIFIIWPATFVVVVGILAGKLKNVINKKEGKK